MRGNLWQLGLVTKEYLAIVHGVVDAPAGQIDLPLGKDESSPIAIKDTPRPDGHAARTRWWRLRQFSRPEGDFSLLRVRLDTGRKHQIRIHLAHLRHPVVGDKIYGPSEECYLEFIESGWGPALKERLWLPRHALHSCVLEVPHGGSRHRWESLLPGDLRMLFDEGRGASQ